MKTKTFVLAWLFVWVPTYMWAQVGGNKINRNYNSYNSDSKIPAPYKVFYTDSSIVIQVDILENAIADYYLVTLGITQRGKTVAETYDSLNKTCDKLATSLKQKGFGSDKIKFDFVNQYKILELKELNSSTYKEEHTGFEANQTATIRIEKIEDLQDILLVASQAGIYDLVKVDYMLNDLNAHKQKLMAEAISALETKKNFYIKTANMKLEPHGSIYSENYVAIQPAAQYHEFRSASSSEVDSYGESRYKVITEPRPLSFYYETDSQTKYDKVLNPQIFTPSLQLVYTLQVKYNLAK